MVEPVARGACLCGAVRFRAALPSRWVAHCHCSCCHVRAQMSWPHSATHWLAELDSLPASAAQQALAWAARPVAPDAP